ncbi:MAG: creatininase family protein [Thermofilaceae archaeon]
MSEVEWAKLTYQDLASINKDKTVVILPLGSLEVHGPHMPLGTDTLVAYRIAVEAARRSQPCVVLPPLFYVYVPENRNFPGTISMSGLTVIKMLEEICDEVYRNGFKRILIFNGHGGNSKLLSLFVREMQEKGKPYLLYAWVDPWSGLHELIEKVRETGQIGHACEIETSFGLYLFPELCKLERVSRPANLGLGREQLIEHLETMVDWVVYAVEGYVGDPRAASKQKGEMLFNELLKMVTEVINKVRNDELYEKILMDFYSRAGY